MHTARRRYLVITLLGALFAALPVLAWLQYRWIGEAGRAEIERTRSTVRRSAGQLAGDFDNELNRFHSVVLTTSPGEGKQRDRYGARYGEWLTVAPHPRIIKSLLITEGGTAGLAQLYQWNRARVSFDPIAWPRELEPLHHEFISRLRPGSDSVHIGPPGIGVDVPALVAPRTANPRMQFRPGQDPEDQPGRPGDSGPDPSLRPRPQAPPSPDGWAIAWLDLEYLRSTWMPELVKKYFSPDGQPDYDVRIVSRVSGRILYDSDPSASAAAFRKPDAEAVMLPVRAGPRNPPGERPDPEFNRRPPGAGRWLLQVRDRSGQLENEVARGRARNLAVSAGVLLLMAGSLIALLFAMRRAERLSTQQMQFVAAVSHELRTPLAVIRSAAENLADGIVTGAEPVKEYGAVIREEGRRLSFLVEQTLRFAGIETGRARYNLVPCDANVIIEDALKSCEGALRNSGCKLETTIDSNLPRVLADPSSLSVCVGNLLTNAAKHGRSGGWIGVHAQLARHGLEHRVHIDVSDRGAGIEARDLPHIFDPFYRGRRAELQQIAGTGLGLALVRQIITAHKGDITVASRPGEGTCFTLSVPAANSGHPA